MTITISLNSKSIASAVKSLNSYADGLERKSEKLVQTLGDAGAEYARNYLMHNDTGATKDSINFSRDGKTGYVSAGGAAVWIEFGTGVIANNGNSPHPKRDEVGAVPWGEYGHGLGKGRWWFINKEGKQCWTAGIPMNPFMLQSADSMRADILRLAKEAFRID